MQSEFKGKTVLITGAASGFGRLLATRLSAEGAKLVLGDVNEAGLKETAAGLKGAAELCGCDVSREADVAALCDLAKKSHGGLDIAVNNAGMSTPMKRLVETTEEDLDRVFAVNAKGVFFGMKHQIPLMLEGGGGSILNVASIAGLNGAPKLTAYTAAKHAVVGMTRTAAVEYARKGIRINAICPFYSPTPMVTESNLGEIRELLESGVPMKRLGEPEEIVATMFSILNPSNSYLTGQAIAVDGGVSAL
jgi:NAD(P)-dependent dehydrogenase (short-subunit alcohol dehydrogenase family)